MPRVPKIVVVSDEELALQKAAVAERCQRFEVTGISKIEDSISRESKELGEFVMLDPERIVIPLLISQGLVKPAPEAKPKAGKEAA
jgi:hypothetical protein